MGRTTPFAISFGQPQHGWLPIEIQTSETKLAFKASDVGNDSILNLLAGLSALQTGQEKIDVSWFLEPDSITFQFLQSNGQISVSVSEITSSQKSELLHYQDNAHNLCLIFWRALRRYQTDFSSNEYEVHWKHQFPVEQMNRLTQLIKTTTLNPE